MPVKPFSYESASRIDESGVYITLPALPMNGWPMEVSGNGLRLWDEFSISGTRLSLPDNSADWHISVNYWGEAEDGLSTGGDGASGDFVTMDAMRTFSSFMMIGIQTAFGIQCSEADNVLQAQQYANELQAKIDLLKSSAANRSVEDSPEYRQLVAQNESLLVMLDDLRSSAVKVTKTPTVGESLDTSETTGEPLYVADFWGGVTSAEVTLVENDSIDSLLGVPDAN